MIREYSENPVTKINERGNRELAFWHSRVAIDLRDVASVEPAELWGLNVRTTLCVFNIKADFDQFVQDWKGAKE